MDTHHKDQEDGWLELCIFHLFGFARESEVSMSLSQSQSSYWLERNEQQQTHLNELIRQGNLLEISTSFETNSIQSIFVQGYLPNSLICTLPLTIQPPSTIFKHPLPLESCHQEIIEIIDERLEKWIFNLPKDNEIERLEGNQMKLLESNTSNEINDHSKFPIILNVRE